MKLTSHLLEKVRDLVFSTLSGFVTYYMKSSHMQILPCGFRLTKRTQSASILWLRVRIFKPLV